jgi:hypothetical protein
MVKFSVSKFIFSASDPDIIERASSYIPQDFNWFLFAAGQILISIAILIYYIRLRKTK